MKINILTLGAWGDVQPYVALGVGLQQAGYRVRLTTHETFKALIIREAGQAMIESGRNPTEVLQGLTQALKPVMTERLEQSWQSCQDADAIVSAMRIDCFVTGDRTFNRPRGGYPTARYPRLDR